MRQNKMRDFLVFVLKNSEIVLYFYNLYYRIKNKKVFFEENERRKSLSIFDYKALSKPMPYYPIEKAEDSNYYGYALAFKTYAHVDKVNASIEHGLYLGDRITIAENYRTTRRIIAMGENRVLSFKHHNVKKPVFAIGPYIHYAEPYLSDDEFKALKEELGRVLLVMPVHASKSIKVSYDNQLIYNFIDSVEKDFDTVLICMYFRDILNNPEIVSEYEARGYKIVCAGHMYDLSFVNRLKSIIMLSDYVVSNSHGTNTGFCTYMGKPQTIIIDNTMVKHHNFYSEDVKKIRDEQVKEIEGAFKEYSNNITDYQREVIDKYWGISCIKTPEELRLLLESKK